MRRRRLVAAGAATVALVVAGCTSDPSTVPDDPHELAPSQPPVEEARVTVDTYPAVVDPSVLEQTPDATTETVSDQGAQVHLAWPQLGLPLLDTALTEDAGARVAAYRAAHPDLPAAPPASPGGDDGSTAELNGTWSLVGSDAEVVGVLADTYVVDEDGREQTWSTTWYDAASATIVPGTALVDDPEALADAVTEALDGQPTVDPERLDGALADGAPVIAFTENGELFVGFDEFQVAPGSEGRITVVLTVEQTDELLSDLGEQARDSLLEPGTPPASGAVVDELPAVPGTATDAPGGEASDGSAGSAGSDGSGEATAPPAPAVDCAVQQCVALTFDDGPGADTQRLLGILGAADARATFFLLGQQVATFPEAARAIALAGHEVGVHTWDHKNLTRLTSAHVEREIARTTTVIQDSVGVTPTLFRPPYGASDDAVARRASAARLAEVLWSVDSGDTTTDDPSAVAARTVEQATPGAIVQLHDTRTTTVDAVPAIVAGLRARGFTLVTVSELLGEVEPGASYTGRPVG